MSRDISTSGHSTAGASPPFIATFLERLWRKIGRDDLGPVDFRALERSETPNDALAATPGSLAPGASVDFALPRYALAPEALIDRVERRVTAVAPNARLVERKPDGLRYVTRSPSMRFPDTTVIEAVALPDGATGLCAYARASLGRSDFGKNRQRLRAWLAEMPVED